LIGSDTADSIVIVVRNIKVARSVEGELTRKVQLGAEGWPLITEQARRTGARDGVDLAVRGIDLSDAVVVGIREIDVARCVQRNAIGSIQHRGQGIDVFAAETGSTGAGDGVDPAV
jgi:hypothetical protein